MLLGTTNSPIAAAPTEVAEVGSNSKYLRGVSAEDRQ